MAGHNTSSVEIFGAPGVGKTTFIRNEGLISSQDAYYTALDSIIAKEFKAKVFVPLPSTFVRLFRTPLLPRYDELALAGCGKNSCNYPRREWA